MEQRILQYRVDGKRVIRIGSSIGLIEASIYIALSTFGLSFMIYLLFIMVPMTFILGAASLISWNWDPIVLPWGAWNLQVVGYCQTIWMYVQGTVATMFYGSGPPPLSVSDERRWAEAKRHGLVTEDEFKDRRRHSFIGSRHDSATTMHAHSRAIATPRSRRNSRHGSVTSFTRCAPTSSSSSQMERSNENESQGHAALDDSDDEQIMWMAKTFAQNFRQTRDYQSERNVRETGPSWLTSRTSRSISPVLSKVSLRPESRDENTQGSPDNRDPGSSATQTPSPAEPIFFGNYGSSSLDNDSRSLYTFTGSTSTLGLAQDGTTRPRAPSHAYSASNVSTASLGSVQETQSAECGQVVDSGTPSQRQHKRSRTGEPIRSHRGS